MRWRQTRLDTEPALSPPGVISLTGAGGKTSMLFALGQAFASAGERVICTTTTRMYPPRPLPGLVTSFPDSPAGVLAPREGFLFIARDAAAGEDPEKVHGYRPEEIDALYRSGAAGRIVVEADGAARRMLKAPAAHEPVIPSSTRAIIALIGLSCLHKPLGPETVFRPELVAGLSGLRPGGEITPHTLAALAVHPQGLFKNTPPKAARLLFCNQGELPGALEGALALSALLSGKHPGFLHGLYCGSLQKEGLRCLALPVE